MRLCPFWSLATVSKARADGVWAIPFGFGVAFALIERERERERERDDCIVLYTV